MGYKAVVEQIKQLNWCNLNSQELQSLMFLSYSSACEFAKALRIARSLYPTDSKLAEMVSEELQTDNLSYDGYNLKGDHADFLQHFIKKIDYIPSEALKRASQIYHNSCSGLDNKIRAMSVFSREEELPGIFQKILQAKDWSAPGLAAYRFYLEEHITFDSSEGGHGDLTKHFSIDNDVQAFYDARLKMYQTIPKLFEKTVS